MNHKTLITILGMILLVGVMAGFVYASDIIYIGEIENPSGINITDFIAGTTTTAKFSFDYNDNINAAEHFPLIYKLEFNSTEEIPEVWKNDFEIKGGFVERRIFGIGFNKITLECSDEFPLTIDHQIGSETIESGGDGTFYCYNTTEGTISNLRKHNKVSLEITSHPALYPGTYNLTAEMFYLNDTYAPKLRIINESYFDQYFREGSYVDFEVEIKDPYLKDYQAKIIRDGEQDISFEGKSVLNKIDIYHFFQTLPFISDGDYPIEIIAEDFNGNRNETETTIKIDNTPPEIKLIEPTGIVSEVFFVKFNVTDEKAGVNNESVQVRLREIVNGQICPETGGPIGNFSCTTTEWLNLELNQTSNLFEVEINTIELNLTSGEYWLDARAEDILGNKAEWIANEE